MYIYIYIAVFFRRCCDRFGRSTYDHAGLTLTLLSPNGQAQHHAAVGGAIAFPITYSMCVLFLLSLGNLNKLCMYLQRIAGRDKDKRNQHQRGERTERATLVLLLLLAVVCFFLVWRVFGVFFSLSLSLCITKFFLFWCRYNGSKRINHFFLFRPCQTLKAGKS